MRDVTSGGLESCDLLRNRTVTNADNAMITAKVEIKGYCPEIKRASKLKIGEIRNSGASIWNISRGEWAAELYVR